MHAEKSKPIYTLSLGTMVTPEMSEAVKNVAAEAGMRPAEWLRMVVESALSMPKDSRVLLAELLAFREMTLALLFDLNGQLTSLQKDLKVSMNGRTPNELERLVMKAEAKKRTLADKVIEETKQ